MRRISTQWTKHLKDEASRNSFEIKLRTMYADPVFKRLVEILKEKQEENFKSRFDYDNTSWPYHQAHINGRAQLLEELTTLLLIDKEIK
jgi:hypothetical protein